MIARLAELTSKPAKAAEGSKSVLLRNLSHRAVSVSIKEGDRLINFSTRNGTALPQGGSLDLAAPAGEYSIAIEGWPTTERVRVPESGSCSLTVRGAETEYIDLQTIVAEDGDGRRVVILHNQGKVTRGQAIRPSAARAPAAFCGPEWSYYPYVRDTVLIGAGVGAFMSHHHHGRRTRVWIIGCWGWR